jgi:hypothetical protein
MFTDLVQDVAVTFAWWWCSAVALNLLYGALFARAMVVLGTANLSSPLPWLGRADIVPGTFVALYFLAGVPASLAMICVTEALGRRHLYDALWEMPFVAAGAIGGVAVQVRHNRRVRREIHAGSIYVR